MERISSRKTAKVIFSSILMAFLISVSMVPMAIVGQDGETNEAAMEGEMQELPDTINFQSENMEQYFAGGFAYDQLGYSSGKGDFNGDGKEDVVLGAPGYNGTRGGVFIFFSGSKNRVLSYSQADVRIDNSEIGSYFGMKLKVGDVDNDGRHDIVVGGYADPVTIPDLWIEDRSLLEYPKVYLFLGKDGWDRTIPSQNADSVFIGSSREHLFGWEIELGDVTGDGYDDVVISEVDPWEEPTAGGGGGGGPVDYETNIAYDATPSGSRAMTAAPNCFNDGILTGQNGWISCNGFGNDGSWMEYEWDDPVYIGAFKIYHFYSDGSRRILIGCQDMQYWSGGDYKSLGGYNADDLDIYSSGKPYTIELEQPVLTTKFRLYNLLGKTGLAQTSNPSISEWEVFPAQTTSQPFITAPEGRVYVFDGSDEMESEYNVSFEEGQKGYSHVIMNSVNSTGLANGELCIGDINGDNYKDIVIGSDGIQYEGIRAGAVEVIFGGATLPEEIDLFDYSHVNITSFTNFKLGRVAVADLNGDGKDDLITCSPMGFLDMKGGIFVFYGDELFPTGKRSILDYDLMIRGPYEESDIGVQGLPDLNGDGRDELMVHTHNGLDDMGVYWIIYSSSLDGLFNNVFYMHLQDPDVTITGGMKESLFAHSSMDNFNFIDYNEDGTEEIMITEPLSSYALNPVGSGLTYLYYHDRTDIEVEDFAVLDADGADGDILGAEKVYHFEGYVRNTWDLNDFNDINIRFILHGGDFEGETITLFWDRGLMIMNERRDPFNFVEIESSSFNPDDNDGMHIYFNLSFSSNMPTEEYIDLLVDVSAGLDLSVSLSYPSIFKVEHDVDFLGDLTVISEYNGVLTKGSFVRPNEKIEVTGMRAVFEGTEASPPNDFFSIQMTDNVGNVFINSSSSGKEIYFTYRTQEVAGREEFNITLVDLKGEAKNAAGRVNFFYIVDTDLPLPPEEIIIRADSDIDDLQGYDNDPEVFISWEPTFDETSDVIGYMYSTADGGMTDNGIFTENTQVVFDGLVEGLNEIYVWSVDSARNYGPSQVATVFYDDDLPSFGIPNPAPGSWVNTNTVNYEMVINDEDGSGVRGSTVEYAVSYDGGMTYSAWEPTNLRNEGEQVTVKVFLNFREGEGNFIRWRAKDISGNGYIESEPFQVKVDTVPLTYKSPVPSEPVDDDYVVCGVTLTDTGSGVDASTIEYAISYDGVSNYGPWEVLDISGSYDNLEIETPPIYFERGTLNYIKWRAKDISGNGYTYSEDLPIDVMPARKNRNPVAIITNPQEQINYLESQKILFDGSMSTDPDGDELKYLWYSDKDGYLGTDPVFEKRLSQNNHLITLHVDDGIANRSISLEVKVIPDPTAMDTDNDGIPDFNDDDDDNDGLLDIQEDINKNGLIDFDLNETDPKNPDTDGDGFDDSLDASPLNPEVREEEDESVLPWYIALLIVVLIVIGLVVAGLLFVMKQRVDKKGLDARRSLRRTRRNVKRFEVLTGVPTNDLPAIEAVQWALPAVINEASEFQLEEPPSEDLLPEAPSDEDEEDVKKPDLEDMEVPEPASPPEESESEPSIGDEVPGPEAPESPESSEGPEEADGSGHLVNCSLCGSEIPVPEGAGSVECPLCGEINEL